MTLPEDEFILLKEKANFGGLGTIKLNLTEILNNMLRIASEAFDEVMSTNFFEKFPLSNTQEIFPEFNIDDNEEISDIPEISDTPDILDIPEISEISENKEVQEILLDLKLFNKESIRKDTKIGPILSEELITQIKNSFNSNKDIFEIIEESITYIDNSISNRGLSNRNSYNEKEKGIFTFGDEVEIIKSIDDDIFEITTQNIDDNNYEDNKTVVPVVNNIKDFKFKTKNVTMTVKLGG
ncbi:hypothetical protein PIROE2DRAFT_56963 [Piromyces sp. E2]|nr:hypothetical protein PIROE2DRAFT_56963 [Piromyces sp. E2]|eukprot:OUM70306.1 hypothetical protein PIROE2DRAFT_56963 [Piromyces sp. E2]